MLATPALTCESKPPVLSKPPMIGTRHPACIVPGERAGVARKTVQALAWVGVGSAFLAVPLIATDDQAEISIGRLGQDRRIKLISFAFLSFLIRRP